MNKQIKVRPETKAQLDILRGAGATLTYDAIIQALIQAQRMLRLLGQDETGQANRSRESAEMPPRKATESKIKGIEGQTSKII